MNRNKFCCLLVGLLLTILSLGRCDIHSSSTQPPQKIMIGVSFANPNAALAIARNGVGGILFDDQATSVAQIQNAVNVLSYADPIKPIFAVDEEGGFLNRVSVLPHCNLNSPAVMAALMTPTEVYSAVYQCGLSMHQVGITMDLAPVVDLASANNEMGRSFGTDPTITIPYDQAFVDGLSKAGITAVIKHFPGAGQASGNTDNGAASVPPLSELQTYDLLPFEQVHSPAMMVSNAQVPGLTGNVPASVSAASYNYIRNTLNYKGFLITDSLVAQAITAYGITEPAAAIRAIDDGADMVILSADAYWPTIQGLAHQVHAS